MIAEIVLKTIELCDAFAGAKTVIVAVSGGCDSVAMLHLLKSLHTRLGVDLHVASLDHGIRIKAGMRDLEFVRDLAVRWRMPYTLGQVDVPHMSRNWGMGIEAAARRARYDFLAQVAKQQASTCVVVGHHALDQAETVLMHIVRGSGMRGLGGMRTVSPMPYHREIKLVRPLLSLTRFELEAYCSEHNLAYQHDESNCDTTFARNYLRHEVIDKLKRLNPGVLVAFSRLAESTALDEDFISEHFESRILPAVHRWQGGWRIKKSVFFELHQALQRRLLREAFRQLAQGDASLSHAITRELIDWSRVARTGSHRDIGASLQLHVGYEDLFVLREGGQETSPDYRTIPVASDYVLSSSAPYGLNGLLIRVATEPPETNRAVSISVRPDCELRLRTRRSGDRFKPKGMDGRSRKVKDWMIDRKIPRHIRDQIPLITADGEIIAICLGVTWHLADLDSIEELEGASKFVLLE